MTVDLKNATPIDTGNTDTREYIFGSRYNMYNDNYKKQVEKRLTEIYANASLLKMDKQLDMTNNVYKTIVNKISRVYTSGVDRVFGDESMVDVYKENRIDKYMKQANRYVNAFNDMLMQVSWDTDNNKPRFVFRYPHKTRVVIDDMGNPSEVEYFVSNEDDEGEKWAFWSNEKHYYKVYDKNGEATEVAVVGNEDMVNPYNVLPFVFMQNGFRDSGFFDPFTGSDLVEVTLDMAVYNTFKNYMIKWQSFKQVVVTGNNVSKIQGQVLDPSQALTADGDDVKIDVLDMQANLEELKNVIDSQMVNVAINYNISPSQFRMTGQVSSGFALQMENTALDEFTAEQQTDFIDYEKDLNKLLVIIGNVNRAGFSESADFDVSFADITYSESPKETVETQKERINLGLTNPVEIIQNEDNIDEDAAIEKYEENIKYRNVGNENLNKPTLDEKTTAEALGLEE